MESIPVRDAARPGGGQADSETTISPALTAEPLPPAKEELLAHLLSIAHASEDALTSTTLDGTIVVWNPGAERLFGYSAVEAVGRPLSLLVPPDRLGELAAMLNKLGMGECVVHYETVRMHKDGTPIPIALTASPVQNSAGQVIGAAAIVRDLTEQKRLERELHRWRDQLQAIAQGVDDAVVVRAHGGQIVYANAKAAHLLGFNSVGALVANPTADTHRRFAFYDEAGELIPPDRLPGILALRGMEVPPTVIRFRLLHTGEERWAVIKAIPIRDEQGRVEYAASIFTDITERKRAEEAYRASEIRFQAFMENSPIVAFIKDAQGRFVYVNPQFERAFETTAAAVLGASDTQVVPDEVAQQIHRDDAEVLATGRLKQIVEVIPGPDGTPHHWLTFKFPLSLPDGQRFIAGASIEITDRVRVEEALKESEARFQAFMHNAPVVAYMKDEVGRVVFLNHAWEQLFGIPVSEALGKDDFQLQPPDRAAQFRAADQEVLRSGQGQVVPETMAAADGTLRHWMTFKFPIVLPAGARFVGGASVEITERVRAEEELQRYAERLRTLSRQLIEAQEAERRRIARDLHDQVGQSLTAIKIDLQVAQHQAAIASLGSAATTGDVPGPPDNTGGSPHGSFIERLGQSIELVERTIQQVREFSLDLRPSILDDLGLPSALLWYAEEQARRAGFTAELAVEQLPARLSPEMEITCFRIAQEAITNVVRHAEAGRVAVELRHSGDELVLTISDDGMGFDLAALRAGMPPGETPRSTAQEYNVGAAGSGSDTPLRKDGIRIRGLGLTGMSERVQLVGGRLSIDSRPGAGTTVRAVFPLHSAD
jgi:PAS domain S-box-containing protein